jgi:hypothetical protein
MLEVYATVHDGEAFAAKPAGVFGLMAGHQPARSGDDAPPRQSRASRENVSDRSGGARKARFLRHLAVRGHLSFSQRLNDSAHSFLEVGGATTVLSSHRQSGHHGRARPYPLPLCTWVIRALTSFRTRAAGRGLSAGKRIVPLPVSYFLSSASSSDGT